MSCDDRITVRGHDLATEIIGQMTFTELLLLDVRGELPGPAEVRVVDAVLVALMEHGLTPSSVVTRLALDAAPESLQGAMSAGMLAVGSRFLGVIEDVARLLQGVVADAGDEGPEVAARTHVQRLLAGGHRVPGFGHNLFAESDPRVEALLGVARHEGVAGPHTNALPFVRDAVAAALRRPIPINTTGAVGAILSDLGNPPEIVRGFALVARCAGLLAHVADERRLPLGRTFWEQLRDVRTTE